MKAEYKMYCGEITYAIKANAVFPMIIFGGLIGYAKYYFLTNNIILER